MRIALVSDCYTPRLGGIETQVRDLALQLLSEGHEVEVITATPVDDRRGFFRRIEDGVPVHRLALHLPGKLPVNPFASRMLRAILPTFDVVHVHTGLVSPFAQDTLRLLAHSDIPTVTTWHCMLGCYASIMGKSRIFSRWARAGIMMNAVSSAAARQVSTAIRHVAPVGVIPNGVDVSAWRSIFRPQVAPSVEGEPVSSEVHLVSAMRLASRKRPTALIRIAAELKRTLGYDKRFTLTIYGEGPQRKRMERIIALEDLEEIVKLPGRVDRGALAQEYAQADIFVLPTELESFGIAVLEARSAGLPVVVRNGTGMEDFVADGVNGYLADSDQEMTRALAKLIRDPEHREAMRNVNENSAPNMSWEGTLAATMDAYERARNTRSGYKRQPRPGEAESV